MTKKLDENLTKGMQKSFQWNSSLNRDNKTVSQLWIQRDFLILVNSVDSKFHSKQHTRTYSKCEENVETFLSKLETSLNAHNSVES
jgi:hypothetical protein